MTNRLSKHIDQKQQEFDAFNLRLSEHQFPESCKGRLVLELWEDYDELKKLETTRDLVDAEKIGLPQLRFPNGQGRRR